MRLLEPFEALGACAGVDEDVSGGVANEEAVQPEPDPVLAVGLGVELPLRLGHLTEHRAPVDQDGSIADYVDERSPELHRTPPAMFVSGESDERPHWAVDDVHYPEHGI